jgi:hypothetical protein
MSDLRGAGLLVLAWALVDDANAAGLSIPAYVENIDATHLPPLARIDDVNAAGLGFGMRWQKRAGTFL